MKRHIAEIKKCIGGYDTRQVNNSIRRITKLQDEEIEQLKSRIQQLELEKEKLSRILLQLQQKNVLQSTEEKLEQLALARLKSTILAMWKQTEEEKNELDEQAKLHEQLRKNHEEQLRRIHHRYGSMVESFLQDIDDDALAESDVTLTQAVPQADASAPVEEAVPDESKVKPEFNLKQGQIIHFKKRNILKDVQTNSEQDHEMEPVRLAEAEAAATSMSDGSAAYDSKNNGSSFWGSIDSYINVKPEKEPLITEPVSVAEAIAEDVPFPFQDISFNQPSDPLTKTQESSAISDEILSIRYRYIVGKEAGEDLYGRDGRLIAAKNQRITEQMVEQADREGRLPDLIVNMKIPGLGDVE